MFTKNKNRNPLNQSQITFIFTLACGGIFSVWLVSTEGVVKMVYPESG